MTKNDKIIIQGKEIEFPNKEIRNILELNNYTIIVFQADYPPKNCLYSNVIAISNIDGTLIWEIEQDYDLDLSNPYESVIDAGTYLILFKAKGHKVAINKFDGKIIRDIDLMKNTRPW